LLLVALVGTWRCLASQLLFQMCIRLFPASRWQGAPCEHYYAEYQADARLVHSTVEAFQLRPFAAAGFSFSSFNDSSSSRGRSRRRGQHDGRAFSKGFSHGVRSTIWSDINLAEAAAAAQLDPDELHNLVFSRDHPHSENSSGTINKRRRRAKRLTQQKKQAAKGRAAAAGGFGYAEFYWEDADASDADSDDEVLWHHYRASSTGGYNKQQWDPSHGPGRPDWQWWSEEQER
jgi:hypothetical protein